MWTCLSACLQPCGVCDKGLVIWDGNQDQGQPPGSWEQRAGTPGSPGLPCSYGGDLTFAGCQFRGAGHASAGRWAEGSGMAPPKIGFQRCIMVIELRPRQLSDVVPASEWVNLETGECRTKRQPESHLHSEGGEQSSCDPRVHLQQTFHQTGDLMFLIAPWRQRSASHEAAQP